MSKQSIATAPNTKFHHLIQGLLHRLQLFVRHTQHVCLELMCLLMAMPQVTGNAKTVPVVCFQIKPMLSHAPPGLLVVLDTVRQLLLLLLIIGFVALVSVMITHLVGFVLLGPIVLQGNTSRRMVLVLQIVHVRLVVVVHLVLV